MMGSVYVGALEVELLLGDVRSLKHKRAVVRPLLAELRRRYDVTAAETGEQDLWRRAALGVATVSGTVEQVGRVCDEIERWVWSRPDVEVVRVTRWVRSLDD